MDRQDLNTWLAVVLPVLFSALVGYIVWRVQFRQTAAALAKLADEKEKRETIARGHKELMDRVAELERTGVVDSQSLALLKQEMLPMAEAMKRKLIDILTHPHDEFKIPDELLAELNEVGAEMPEELKVLMDERVHSQHPDVTPRERLAAEALPVIAELAALEATLAPEMVKTTIQLVSTLADDKHKPKEEEEEEGDAARQTAREAEHE